ncbi:MAG: hypothetical protein HY506_00820 [Candidatus Yanofskybacteria bacterium]|nr:hypothetical protein [Candidatus Yanofskybacteria bacterium]
MPEKTEKELQVFFAPFSNVSLTRDAPILAYVFESQEDPAISEHFPEVEARRRSLDKIRRKGDETATLQSVMREDKAITLGIVYVKYPWQRRRQLDVGSINFLREVSDRTIFITKRVREEGFSKLVVLLPSLFSPQNIQSRTQQQQLAAFVKEITESIIYANNFYDDLLAYKDRKLTEIIFAFFGESQPAIDGFCKKTISEGMRVGEALSSVRKLIETPSNLKAPIKFIEQIAGRELNLRPRPNWQRFQISPRIEAKVIYGLDALRSQGFELIAAVGQGSNNQPCLLQLRYKPKTNRKKRVRKVVLTGKGVTFDSGGYDLKLSDNYDRMNYDVAGASNVVGVMRLAEEINLPVEIIGIIPVVENLISSKAVMPGTILKSFGGRTVQIVNTDAEGRLLMAEALAFAEKKFRSSADAMVTVATLSNMTDFGPDLLKVWATSRTLEQKVRVAERLSSEKMFLFPPLEHFNHVDEMHTGRYSDLVSDLDEYFHTSPAVFMYNFFSYEPVSWVFIDISAVFEEEAPEYGAGPGFGLKFLWYLLQQFV